jgi:hypothetical protein
MKKLKLNKAIAKVEVLTKEQLKLILGGEFVEGSCSDKGQTCYGTINCCNGLHCNHTTQLCED